MILWTILVTLFTWAFCLALVASMMFVVYFLGIDTIPVLVGVIHLWRIINTLVYLDLRQLNDGTNPLDRMNYPNMFPNKPKRKIDRWGNWLYQNMVDLQQYTYFNKKPVPYLLFYYMSPGKFVLHILPTTIMIGFSIWAWFEFITIDNFITVLEWWAYITLGCLVIKSMSLRISLVLRIMYASIELLSLRISDIMRLITLGAVPGLERMSSPRLRLTYLMVITTLLILKVRM